MQAALARYFLTLGATGFGGPLALVGSMQRDLVERRKWFTPAEFADGLALAQASPGPLAAQLAMYLGWLRGGVLGATSAGLAFVIPPFLLVVALAVLYRRAGALPWIEPAFLGVGAAVIAILARSTVKLSRLTLRADPLLWVIAAGNAAAVLLLRREWLTLLLLSGVLCLLARAAWSRASLWMLVPVWPLPLGTLATPVSLAPLGELFLFFTKAGAAVFGSGLAIIPFLYTGLVEQRHWLTEPQFRDAVAVAMLSPGPVVITAAFIGYLLHGFAGAAVASLGVFAPCWLVIILAAPRYAGLVAKPAVRRFVDGVTAATTGALAGAAVLLASRILSDGRAMGIAAATALILLSRVKLPEPILVLGAGVVSVLLAA